MYQFVRYELTKLASTFGLFYLSVYGLMTSIVHGI